ncbi:TPA: EpsG family protein [Enterobacter ludwigii]|nr:EpsG family protein [Enterobacter ludwigii]
MAIKHFRMYMLFLCMAAISLFFGLRMLGQDSDFISYETFYDSINNNFAFSDTRFEFGFVLVSYFFKEVLNADIHVLLVVTAFISLTIKEYLFFKGSNTFLITIVYLMGMGLLHEMTQIRVAIAISFVLLSLHFKSNDRTKLSFLFFILSMLFHYSMAFFIMGLIIPNAWLANNKLKIPVIFLYAVIAAVVLYFIQGVLISNFSMIRLYASRADNESFNFASIRFMGLLLPLIIGVFSFNNLSVFQKRCFIISMAAYAISIPASLIPTIASRIFELGWTCFYFWVPGVSGKWNKLIALFFLTLVSVYFAVRNIYLEPIFGMQ